MDLSVTEISTTLEGVAVTAAKTFSGKVLPPRQHLLLFTAVDWEEFVCEWAQHQKSKYKLVARLGGANDYGIDVACFSSDEGFQGKWDNFQCKYYTGNPLAPSTALPEVGKILWHAFQGNISLPERYFFFAPKDCGPALKKLLLDATKLKKKLFEEWDSWCSESITSVQKVWLSGAFLEFVENVDFGIFKYKPTHEVLEDHRKTPFYVPRFGGGLPDRPAPPEPPTKLQSEEFRYVEQLCDAYSDKHGYSIFSAQLPDHPQLERHFKRQREAFFHAEALKTFARDTVPNGTFEALQDEICDGVIDVSENDHSNGFERLTTVILHAGQLNLTANGLIQATKQQDRRGICHQLANEDRLTWVPNND